VKSFRVESFPENSYNVLIENGLVKHIVDILHHNNIPISETVYLLTENHVANLYLEEIVACFSSYGIRTEAIVVQAGEGHKSFTTYQLIIEELLQKGMMRRALLVLIGGGMIMDLGGFVAATFMRGVPLINIPTSLVAQVDAAVGGKVAINHQKGKNLIGNFYNPRLVCIDPSFLLSLDKAQIQEGLAEVIKVAVIQNTDLFDLIETQKTAILSCDLITLQRVIELAVLAKIELLRPDPLEVDLRRILNFGHTLAHPLETMYQYDGITHGKAVALGMSAASVYAAKKGYTTTKLTARILDLIRSVGLPTSISISVEDKIALHRALDLIIKVRNGRINLVLPAEIGKAIIVSDVDVHQLIDCLEQGL
jgi:3-dehydroquinate synthase